MKRAGRSRRRTHTFVLLECGPAEAHLNATGMGPVYDGLVHFLTSPEDLVPALALALLAGLRGAPYGRRAMFTLPAAWLLGSLFGLSAAVTSAGTWGGIAVVPAAGRTGRRRCEGFTAHADGAHGVARSRSRIPQRNGSGPLGAFDRCRGRIGCRSVRTGRPRHRARRSTARAVGTNSRACRRKLDCRERPAHAGLVGSRGLSAARQTWTKVQSASPRVIDTVPAPVRLAARPDCALSPRSTSVRLLRG